MSDPTTNRPPLGERLLAGLTEALEWTRGERRLKGSEMIDGQWVDIEDTGPEYFERRAEQEQEVRTEEAA